MVKWNLGIKGDGMSSLLLNELISWREAQS